MILFDGSGSVDTDGRIVEYLWDFGDGTSGSGMQIPYSFSQPRTYEVTLTVRDNTAESDGVHRDTMFVFINDQPVAKTSTDKIITQSIVEFDGSQSFDRDGTIIRYDWDFGDGNMGEGPRPVHTYQQSGVYEVKLTVTDDSGTSTHQDYDKLMVIVNKRPSADAGPEPVPVAPGEPVFLLGAESHDPDGEITSYVWNLGDGNKKEGVTIDHSYEKPGTYRAFLQVQDNTENEKAVDFDEVIIKVNDRPTADAGKDIETAPGLEIVLDGRASFDPDGTLVEYQWEFSDNSEIVSESKTTRTFKNPGLYLATLTVFDDSGASNGTHQDTVNIHVNHSPQAEAGSNQFLCDGIVHFDGTASVDPDRDPLTYLWDFGDGTTATGSNPSHVYSEGGIFPVTLTVDDKSGMPNSSHRDTLTVQINHAPKADAGGNRVLCSGEPNIFTGANSYDLEGGVLKYRWNFGDGTTSDLMNPIQTYQKGGDYQTSLTVTDDSGLECNIDTDRIVVQVADSPIAHAGPDQTVCAGIAVKFDGSKSWDSDGIVDNFEWDFGDGNFGSGSQQEHIYSKAGDYYAVLTITGSTVGQCDNVDTDELFVKVYDAPVASIESEDVIPVNTLALFDGSASSGKGANIVSWDWDFGNGETASGEKVDYAFPKSGKFLVTLTISTDAQNNCEVVSIQKNVTINEAPIADAGENRVVGVDEPVLFNAQRSVDLDGSILKYEWDFADGNQATGIQTRHRFRKSGTYPVRLTVTDNTDVANHAHTAIVDIIVNDPPVPVIDAPKHVCPRTPVTLKADQSSDQDGHITKYVWDFGDGTQGEGVEVVHEFEQTGYFQSILKVTDNTNVSNSQQKVIQLIHVNKTPLAAAGPDHLACPNQNADL